MISFVDWFIAVGLARAKGFVAQVHALGQRPTAIINVTTALAERDVKIMSEIRAVGGGGGREGVGATLMKFLTDAVRSPASPGAAAGTLLPKDGHEPILRN
jgi:hypothetical protein